MRKFNIFLLCCVMICILSACGSSVWQKNEKDSVARITVQNATSEELYGIGYAWYVNGDLQSSGGACYADNSAIKIGDLFSLDSQSYLEETENVEIELSVVNKSGKEYPCTSRIGIDIEAGTTCEIKITGDYEDGFCASIVVGKSK